MPWWAWRLSGKQSSAPPWLGQQLWAPSSLGLLSLVRLSLVLLSSELLSSELLSSELLSLVRPSSERLSLTRQLLAWPLSEQRSWAPWSWAPR